MIVCIPLSSTCRQVQVYFHFVRSMLVCTYSVCTVVVELKCLWTAAIIAIHFESCIRSAHAPAADYLAYASLSQNFRFPMTDIYMIQRPVGRHSGGGNTAESNRLRSPSRSSCRSAFELHGAPRRVVFSAFPKHFHHRCSDMRRECIAWREQPRMASSGEGRRGVEGVREVVDSSIFDS